MMNATLRLGSSYNCDEIAQQHQPMEPVWRHTVMGCRVVKLLQDMYQFNITYESITQDGNISAVGSSSNLSLLANTTTLDLFLHPLTLQSKMLENAYPLETIVMWRLGFILQRIETCVFSRFYSKPFSRPTWNSLYLMAVLVTLVLYLMKWWEKRHLGGWDCCLVHEMLVVIGAYCQHIPPLDAVAPSRRMAYFTFFMYAYVVYTFYTSNLLSHLVNDKDHTVDLQTLASSDYKFVIVDNIKLTLAGSIHRYSKNISLVLKKLIELDSVNATAGLEAVRQGRTALLSDFSTIYPIINEAFNNDDICKLIEIDLYSQIKKYLFTSKHFPYKEQFKIGILRIREAGILRRMLLLDSKPAPKCELSPNVKAKLVQISIPLTVLGVTYVVCLFILCCEKWHFERNRVWPYVE